MGEEELTAEQLAEQIKKLSVSDLLLSTVSTLGQLAYVKLAADERDQARLAIDAFGALLPTLEDRIEKDLFRDLSQMLANVRIAFATEATKSAEPPQTDD